MSKDNKITTCKKELISKCKNRLTTQTRVYYFFFNEKDLIIYPIRTIKKILSRNTQTKKEWENYIEELIDNINVFYKSDEEKNNYKNVRLKDVEKLIIKNKKAYIKTKTTNKEYAVYSKIRNIEHKQIDNAYEMKQNSYKKLNNVYIKKEKLLYIEMNDVGETKDIHIDHEIPMQKIMKDKYKELKGLQKLNKKIINYSKENNIKIISSSDEKYWSKDEAIKAYNLNEKDITSLMSDIKKIRMELNLMDKNTNLRKSNSI